MLCLCFCWDMIDYIAECECCWQTMFFTCMQLKADYWWVECTACLLFRQYRSKSAARNTDTASDRQPRVKRIDVNYEYFDGGNHFCRCCNCFSINIFEHCQHLISSSHQQVDCVCWVFTLVNSCLQNYRVNDRAVMQYALILVCSSLLMCWML